MWTERGVRRASGQDVLKKVFEEMFESVFERVLDERMFEEMFEWVLEIVSCSCFGKGRDFSGGVESPRKSPSVFAMAGSCHSCTGCVQALSIKKMSRKIIGISPKLL
jgi:hypothetical protein